jgi:hypothetical protein
MIAQVVFFRLKTAAARERFLELTQQLVSWLQHQPGFISYDLVEGEHAWSDRLVWQTAEHAQRANDFFLRYDLGKEMLKCVNPDIQSVMGKFTNLANSPHTA